MEDKTMNVTPNIGLKLPSQNDYYDVDVTNENSNVIDLAIKDLMTKYTNVDGNKVPYYGGEKILGLHYNPNADGLYWYANADTPRIFWDNKNFNPSDKLTKVEMIVDAVPKDLWFMGQVQNASPDYCGGAGGGSQHFMIQASTAVTSGDSAYIGQIAWGYDILNPRLAVRCKNPHGDGEWRNVLMYDQVLGQQGHISGHSYMENTYPEASYLHAFPTGHTGNGKPLHIRTGNTSSFKSFVFGTDGVLEIPAHIRSLAHSPIVSSVTGMHLHSNSDLIGFLNRDGNWILRASQNGDVFIQNSLLMSNGQRVYNEGDSIGFLNTGNGWIFRIDNAGNTFSTANVVAYSDIKLKKDIKIIPDAIDKIQALNGYTYTRKDTGERQTGVIAQEVLKVMPEAVNTTKDKDGEETLGVAYGNLVGLLIEGIKELKAEIEELKRVR